MRFTVFANMVKIHTPTRDDVDTLKLLPRIAVMAIAVFSISCSEVAFHEKERLNDRIMSFDDDPAADKMRQHMITPREGAIGGFSSVGAGGCACK